MTGTTPTVVLAARFPEMSLRGPRLLRRTARWIKGEVDAGYRPVVVIGTRSRREERGLDITHAGAPVGLAGAREIDRARAAAEELAVASLALALSTLGVTARSVSASEVELEGEGGFGAGVLRHLDTLYLTELVADGITPVLAGGHVLRADGEITMLEPGGADLTAVTLAGALGGVPCHIVVDHADRVGKRTRRVNPEAQRQAVVLGVSVVERSLEPRPTLVLESVAIHEPITTPLGGLP